jgi:pyrimidine-nucleoside phosphorylase
MSVTHFSMVELIGMKRDGDALSADALDWIIRSYVDGTIPDYQMSALLMAIFLKGMTGDELAAWTRAMLHSGDVLDCSTISGKKVDKHSTGGVGDKVTIPLAPMVAACGVPIPMMSGRGLGHTGGTRDKLESIRGMRTAFDPSTFMDLLHQNNVVLGGQSETLVPADRLIYALRDASATVPSIPLISSSIMSKKLAEDLDGLVLDVKVGSGAFMKTVADARILAETMVEIGASHDTRVVAFLTNMDQPLGNEIGNASEIRESIDVLRGGGPADLIEITYLLGREMLILGAVAETHDEAQQMLSEAVESGRAFEKFRTIVSSQGGDVAMVDNPNLLPTAENTHVVRAPVAGYVHRCDALDIGIASVRLGGGRETKEADIDPSVGITVHAKVGAAVQPGDPLATITYAETEKLEAAIAAMEAAWQIGPVAVEDPPILLDEVR